MKIDENLKLPEVSLVKTGEKIRELRMGKGVSVDDLCFVLDLNATATLYHWEKGKNFPSINNLVKLAKIFDVTVDEILQVEESEDK